MNIRFNAQDLANTPLKIAIATDAWFPQVNGVVRTLSRNCTVAATRLN